jgi:hypothetical protein
MNKIVYFLDDGLNAIGQRSYSERKYWMTSLKEAKIFIQKTGIKNVKWLKIDSKYILLDAIEVRGYELYLKEHKW